jgi:beta-lactam-binding protein with PASTA domain
MPDDDTIGTGGAAAGPSTGSRLSRGLAAGILLIVIIAAALWFLLPKPATGPTGTGTTPVASNAPTATATSSQTPSNGMVIVPNVFGKTQADADKSLSGSGLIAAHVSEVSSGPVGTVVSQFPDAGTQVKAGTVVDVVLSLGLPSGTSSVQNGDLLVPSVLGLSESAARAKLASAGWGAAVTYAPATAAQQGVVFYQSPGGETYVTGRGTATIWVSRGVPSSGYPTPPLNH